MTEQELHEIHQYIDRAANRTADPLRLHSIFDEAIRLAVAEEREACAVIADKQAGKNRTMDDTKAIARAIRARSVVASNGKRT